MVNSPKRESIFQMVVELVEDLVVLLFLELKRALLEIKENIRSVEKGAAMLVLGAVLLFIALATFTITAIIALAIVLPAWLAALLVALGFTFFGVAFLFGGLGHFKVFTLVPSETVRRVKETFRRYKNVKRRAPRP